MQGLTVSVQISAHFTADQWELYTASHPEDVMATVAEELNTALSDAVNLGLGRRAVEGRVHSVMIKNAKYGAADSEPIGFLQYVLDKVYGVDN